MNIYNGYVRVIISIPPIHVANPLKNAENIIQSIKNNYKYKPSCIIFPELSLTGYTCGDLFTTQKLQTETNLALNNILDYIRNIDSIHSSIYVIGAPLHIENGLYNVAVVLCKQGILGIVPKQYLANDNEFYEKRWFINNTTCISNKIYLPTFQYNQIPFGTNLIFQSQNNEDFKLGIEICRDLWAMDSPSNNLVKSGATIIANISASNDVVGKKQYRRDLVRIQSAKQRSIYLYANASCLESSTDAVYSGHSIIAENGNILSETNSFIISENSLIMDVDLELIKHERIRYNQQENSNVPVHYVYYPMEIENEKFNYLLHPLKKYPFISLYDDEKDKEICEEALNIQIHGLIKRLLSVKPKSISIGLSGGLDSSLALFVLYKALKNIKQYFFPKINVLYIEGYGSTENSFNRAKNLAEGFSYELEKVSILDVTLKMLNLQNHKPFNLDISRIKNGKLLQNVIKNLLMKNPELEDVVFENIQARLRTNILMSKGFTIGTSDLSEIALGFCTYGGDHASMYNPNCGIPKTLVKQILLYLCKSTEINFYLSDVLIEIVNSPISPELIPYQTTEKSLGNYEIYDFILYYFLRHGFSKEKIIYIAKEARWYIKEDKEQEIFLKHVETFFNRFYNQQYKRSFFPDGPKVLDISLSPRTDWRMPSDL